MQSERAILCGNVTDGRLPFDGAEPVRLRLWGPHQNITLAFDDIRHYMVSDIPPRFNDLLEIATYVYCADQAVTRGGDGVDNLGKNWRRRFYFRIPVRDLSFWRSPKVCDQLCETLGFLSEDDYSFEFCEQVRGPTIQHYLKFAEDNTPLGQPEDVVLFSGGLDSLGGAVQEAVIDKRKAALVTHRATDKLSRRHRHLRELLAEHCLEAPPIHIPVSINKDKVLGREYTQRTRSFLYAALAATIARMFGLSRIKFYENGVVSFNLPPSAQVVGARATRTTHPQVINGFAALLSAAAGKRFSVETPFLWLTKAEVVKLIAGAGCSELIKYTTSCTHTWEITNLQTHCGDCSQCIDRRFAVLAAGLEAHDPKEAYKVDLLVDERAEGAARTMLAAYAETASQVARMSPVEFFARYGEASRVLRHVDGSADSAGLKLYELHKRHAQQVTDVIKAAIARHASDILQRTLPPTCLLRLVCDSTVPGAPAACAAAPSGELAREAEGPLGDHVFRREGAAWRVRFAGGKAFILLPSRGTAYLHFLLTHARRAFPVVDIVLAVAKQPAKYALGDAGEVADRDALSAYRAKYQELQEEIEEARKNNDPGQEDNARQELEALAEQVRAAKGVGGRLRKAADDRDRVRKAFRAGLRRACEEIAKYDRRLAEHLSARVKCGWNPCYDPGEEIDWET